MVSRIVLVGDREISGCKTMEIRCCRGFWRNVDFCRDSFRMGFPGRKNKLGPCQEKNTTNKKTHPDNKLPASGVQGTVHLIPHLIRRVHLELIGFFLQLSFKLTTIYISLLHSWMFWSGTL